MNDTTNVDSRFVLLDKGDNILVCCKPIKAGETVILAGVDVMMVTEIDIGHKIAGREIQKGEKIMRYGASIGSAISDISLGQHVHLHNMKSDYIPSHTRKSKVEPK